MNALDGLASTFTPEEKKEAKELEKKIEEVTRTILSEKKSMDSNFVRLAQLINEVRQKKYWLLGEYKTFGDYLNDCEKKFNIGHSQLYVGMKVVRNLLPSVSEEEIVDIGITKAGILSKYVEQSGQNTIPDDILEAAKTKTSQELDAEVNSKLHNVFPDTGKWYALGGFFCSEDEKQEIQDALDSASAQDPVIPKNIPHWQQLREQVLRLAREFRSSYS